MMWRNPSSAAKVASTVFGRITPPEKVSRPSSTPREASSTSRMGRPVAISAITRRMALAPMSSTATSSTGARLSAAIRPRCECAHSAIVPEPAVRMSLFGVTTAQQIVRTARSGGIIRAAVPGVILNRS